MSHLSGGQFGPDFRPVIGAQIAARNHLVGLAFDGDGEGRRTRPLPITDVSKVPDARIALGREGFACWLIGQRLEEGFQVHPAITPSGVGLRQHHLVSDAVSNGGMAENPLKAARVANLVALGHKADALVEKLGRGYTYWQGMLNGSRPFGEKIAREIETTLRLADYALDQPAGVVPKAAGPFRDLSPEEGTLIGIFREIGRLGGREEQEAAAYEMNKHLSRVNAASAKPKALKGDPFPGIKRGRANRPEPEKQLDTRNKAKPKADSKKAR